MLYKLHYGFLTAGSSALGLLLGVYIQEYTDANSIEIGALYMLMPFTGLIFRPIICSKADREQDHQKYLMTCLIVVVTSYAPFIVIPLLGPGVYEDYPRICWYVLITLKIIGDIAFGGVVSIGDALAINYAKRVGTQFSTYRVWGTISWLVFGLIIGLVNEVPFLPKYVPGFMILIAAALFDLIVIWLWPREYFRMIPESQIESETEKQKAGGEEKKGDSEPSRCLMPREVVWAHAKRKLYCLFTGSKFEELEVKEETTKQEPTKEFSGNGTLRKLAVQRDIDNFDTLSVHSMASVKSMQHIGTPKLLGNGASKFGSVASSKSYLWALRKGEPKKADWPQVEIEIATEEKSKVDKRTQVRILFLLIRRDPRVALYLLYFIGAGFTMAPMGFFFMSLSERCHTEDSCNFSMLAGLLQGSMACYETVIFVVIKRVQEKVGRVNTAALGLALYSIKIIFYATIWPDVNPYWSLVSEGFRGATYGVYLTLMVELGYKFSNEVQYLITELMETNVIEQHSDSEHLKLALSSTMQSLIAGANDGLGRGVAALIFGMILHYHADYIFLWRIVACYTVIMILIVLSINLMDYLFKFELGLDVAAAKRKEQEDEVKSKGKVAIET